MWLESLLPPSGTEARLWFEKPSGGHLDLSGFPSVHQFGWPGALGGPSTVTWLLHGVHGSSCIGWWPQVSQTTGNQLNEVSWEGYLTWRTRGGIYCPLDLPYILCVSQSATISEGNNKRTIWKLNRWKDSFKNTTDKLSVAYGMWNEVDNFKSWQQQ